MNRPSKRCFLSKLPNYTIQLISCHISFLRLLNIIRFSKKFQSLLDVSLFLYKKYFLMKNIPINYTTVTVKELLFVLNKEFNNFNKFGDDKILEKIVKEINESEQRIKVNKKDDDILQHYKRKICYFEKFQNLLMKKVIDNTKKLQLIALYLDSKDDEIIDMNNYVGFKFDQMIIKPCAFPHLSILKFDTNFKIPISMLLNLTKLNIKINSKRYLTFINDINVNTISLNHLKYLKLKREEKENNSLEVRNFSVYQPAKKIKLKFPNVESIIINIDLNEDLYILKEYFQFNLIDIKIEDKLCFNSFYNYLKKKILNYKFRMMTSYFKFDIILRRRHQKLLLDCEMFKAKNGLKNYCFRRNIYKNDKNIYTVSESYKENNFNNKKMTLYLNRFGFKYIKTQPIISDINYIVLLSKANENLNRKEIVNIFDINGNNYSIQHIIINLGKGERYFTKLINNVGKFKVLKNLKIIDYIVSFDNLLKLLKNIQNLKLLKVVTINFKGYLNKQSLNLIRAIIPHISYKRLNNSDLIEFTISNCKK